MLQLKAGRHESSSLTLKSTYSSEPENSICIVPSPNHTNYHTTDLARHNCVTVDTEQRLAATFFEISRSLQFLSTSACTAVHDELLVLLPATLPDKGAHALRVVHDVHSFWISNGLGISSGPQFFNISCHFFRSSVQDFFFVEERASSVDVGPVS
jgi:hypothetical protein